MAYLAHPGGQPPAPPGVFGGMGQRFSGMVVRKGKEHEAPLPPAAFRRTRWHRLFLDRVRSRRAALLFTGSTKNRSIQEVGQDQITL